MTTSTQIFGDVVATTMQESDIPDIFDVLEGGENDSAVKFLLGFSAEEAEQVQHQVRVQQQQLLTTTSAPPTASATTAAIFSISGPARKKSIAGAGDSEQGLTKEGKPRKRDPVDPNRCIFSCDSCAKAFTTKFNLKRHINLHCNKSKEAGVPVQGPPSASMPSRKRREAEIASGLASPTTATSSSPKSPKKKSPSKGLKQRPKSNSTSKPSMKGFVTLPAISSSSAAATVMTTTTSIPVMSSPQTVVLDQSRLKPLPPFQSSGSNMLPTAYTSGTLSTLQATVSQQQQQQPVGVIPHPHPVPQQPPQQQYRQLQQRVIQQNTFQAAPTTSVRMVQSLAPQQQLQLSNQPQHQQQQMQQGQFFPQRIVRFVHPQQQVISQGSVPFFQQGVQRTSVYQAIPVSIVSTTGPRGIISRTIQLPQQPLPVIETVSNSRPQFKPMTLNQQTSAAPTMTTSTNGQMPMLATSVSTFMPMQQQQQRVYIQQPSSEMFVPSTTSASLSTPTTNLRTSSFLPMSSLPSVSLDSDLSCPPDEIFDSEDGGDATNNDNDFENASASAVKSLPGVSSSADKNSLNSLSESNDLSDVNTFFDVSIESNNTELTGVSRTPLNLPTNRPRGILLEIPRGWVRKLVTTGKGPRVFYYNTMGKKFSNPDEINQYFLRLGQTVKPGLFNFEPSKSLEDVSVHFLNGKPVSETPTTDSHPMPIVST